MRHLLIKGLAAGATGLMLAGLTPFLPVSAALAEDTVYDWGGDKTVDSGKEHIKFSGPARPGDMVVSFGDRKLYYFTANGEADTYPIAIPREQSRWEGVTTVSQKRENPSWTPTPHMMAENPKLPRWVPGGHPMNPLGIRALYLGSSDYRIHGTDAPWTIGTAASKGCVRMFNKDVVDLYPRVKVGAKVTVTWQKFDGKTLAMAEHAKAVSDPDPDHGGGGKVTPASFNPEDADEAVKPQKVKHHKVVSNDDEAAAEAGTAVQAVPAEKAVEGGKPAVAASDDAAKPKSKSKHAAVSDTATVTDSKPAVADAEPVRKPLRSRKKTVSVAETGSIKAGEKVEDTLSIVQRATAAAERAADAADRAAAAADRALAASQAATGAAAGNASDTSTH